MKPEALEAAIAEAREAIIAAGFFSYARPDPVMDELRRALNLPRSVLVVITEVSEPDSPENPDHHGDSESSPVTEAADATAPDLATPAGYLMHEQIASIQAVAKSKKWQVRVTGRFEGGADVKVVNQRNAVLHSGSVAEVHAAMHSGDNVVALPVPPTDADRLSARIAVHGWSVRIDSSGDRFTLLRDLHPIYSGDFEDVTRFAEAKILNLGQPAWGVTLDSVLSSND